MKFKRALVSLLVLVFFALAAIAPANAAYSYYGSYSFSTGILFWKHNYTAKVYRDPAWFKVYHGSPSVSTGFEQKINGGFTLKQARSFSLSSQTKATLNAGVDFSDYGVPVNVGGSIEQASAASWGVSNETSRTIPDSAPKGWYSYNVCLNTYKIKISRYENGSPAGTIEFFAPRSELYRAIVYNPSNASYTGVVKY